MRDAPALLRGHLDAPHQLLLESPVLVRKRSSAELVAMKAVNAKKAMKAVNAKKAKKV